ncbi:MAG: nuclear transport factor 2 family protein [Pseudomonadota bacterium]
MDVIDRFEHFYQGLATGSLDQLADVYDEQVVFIDPVAEHGGLAALNRYFRSLMSRCQSCSFDVTTHRQDSSLAFVSWIMRFEHAQLRQGKLICVHGMSQITIADDRIVQQRDYYDMGAMVYENVPLLGFVVTGLRRRMAQ